MTGDRNGIELSSEEVRTLINALDHQYQSLATNQAFDLAVDNRLIRHRLEALL